MQYSFLRPYVCACINWSYNIYFKNIKRIIRRFITIILNIPSSNTFTTGYYLKKLKWLRVSSSKLITDFYFN